MPSLKPATPDFLDNAPFRIESSVTALAPIERCWDLIIDQTAWPSWFDGMKLVDASPSTWTAPGDTRVVKVNGLTVHEQALSIVPQQEYAFTIVKWPIPTAVQAAEGIRLEDRTNGGSPRTILTYVGAFESTRFGAYGEKFMGKQLTNTWTAALKNLERLAAS